MGFVVTVFLLAAISSGFMIVLYYWGSQAVRFMLLSNRAMALLKEDATIDEMPSKLERARAKVQLKVKRDKLLQQRSALVRKLERN